MRLLDPDVLDDYRYYRDWSGPPAPHGTPRPWDDRLRQAYASRERLRGLAAELGVSKNTLVGRARDMGLVWGGAAHDRGRDSRGRFL